MIIVFGSIYMKLDMTVKRFPENDGIALSHTYTMTPSGRAANQALAGARCGAKTALVGRVGDDGPGLRILQSLKRNGVMTSGVAKCTEFPTGIATLVHDQAGSERTFLALGANSLISADQAPSDIFREKNVLLTQLEIPLEQNAMVMKAAYDKKSKVVLNASSLSTLPLPLLGLVDYMIINEKRVLQFAQKLDLGTFKDTVSAMSAIAKKANLTCVSFNENGSALAKFPDGKGYKIKPQKTIVVEDLAGSEDCFCGTFTACLHEGKPIIDALKSSIVAYAIVAGQKGEEEVYPYFEGVQEEAEGYGDVKPL